MSSTIHKAPILVAGAGLTGLSCAYHLKRPYELWERDDSVGGLSRTDEVRGFRFDKTGHWLHTRHAWTRQLITERLGIELVEITRNAVIHSHGVRTPYPFQANTYGLPIPVVAECLQGYFAARERRARGETQPATTFGDHIRDQLGDGIAKHFMFPYNTKLWTVPPDEMSARWCKRFVPSPEPEEVVLGALRREGAGHQIGYNNTFWYPRKGGIGVIANRLHDVLPTPAALGRRLTRIDQKQHLAYDDAGNVTSYASLVTTAPLTELITSLENPPARIKEAATRLRSAAVTYWNIAFKGSEEQGAPHWVYFPESEFPFYRMGSPSAVLANLAPVQHRSCWVEVSHRSGSSTTVTEQAIMDALAKSGVSAPGEEPTLMERRTIPIAYVIMDARFEALRDEILAWLAEQGIFSTGRYGAWTYNSMEDSIIAGREAAQSAEEYCATC